MEEEKLFQSEFVYDLPMHQEYTRLTIQSYNINIVLRFLAVVFVAYSLPMLEYSYNRWIYFVFCCGIIVPRLIQLSKRKKGDLAWEQTLHRNGGQPPHQQVFLDDKCIHSRSLTRDSEISDPYEQVKYLIESENLLLAITKLRMAYFIDKRTLEGGTRQELIDFLRQKSPKMKKKIKTGKFYRIAEIIMWASIILGLLVSLAYTLHIPEQLRGQITGNMSYEEIAQELLPLGIEISPEVISELNRYSEENPMDFMSNGTTQVLNLLCWEGQGRFEKNVFYQEGPMEAFDWNWTPSTSGVYWFDLEFISFGDAYTNFLKGVMAMDSSLSFTNVAEDYSNASILEGQGEIGFSFDYLDKHYQLIAKYNDDWFDTEILYELGKILSQDLDPKNLWYTTDGQSVLLYYGTQENAKALQRKTGLYFLDPVANYFTMGMG